VWDMRSGDDLERRGNVAQLLLAQPCAEMLADAAQVCAGGVTHESKAARRESHNDDSRIARSSCSLDEALADEPINAPGEGARRHEHSLRELGHPERLSLGAPEPYENVIGVQRNAVLRPKLPIESAGDVVVGVEECLPGTQFFVSKPGPHRCPRV
jgi:hypothetical protein